MLHESPPKAVKGARTDRASRARRAAYAIARAYAHRAPHRGVHRAILTLHPLDARVAERAVSAVVPFEGVRLRVDTADLIGWRLYFFGTYRPDRLAVLRSLKPGDVALDIGASQGMFTCVMARNVGAAGAVHAFEPWPSEFEKCAANVALNGFENVMLNRVALSHRVGAAALYGAAGANQSRASLVANSTPDRIQTTCRTTTVDEYARPLSRLDFISLDAQGADFDVLRGAEVTLERLRPRLLLTSVCEPLYRAAGTSSDEIAGFLRDRRYHVSWIQPKSWRSRSSHDSYALSAEPLTATRKAAA